MNKVSVIDDFRASLSKMDPQFKKVLPASISLDRFSRIAMTAVSQNPELLKADRSSLFMALMKAAELGLNVDGREAALVPYGPKVTLIPMILGILKKVRNSGELESITAQEVYANDDFQYYIDSNGEFINFRPAMFQDRGEIKGFFALAKTKDSGIFIELMSKDEVDQIRATSKSKNSPAWGNFYNQMAKKCVLKRLCKRLPVDTDTHDLFHEEEVEEPVVEKKTRTSRVSKLIKEKISEVVDMEQKEPDENPNNVVVENFQIDDEPAQLLSNLKEKLNM